MPGKWLRDDDQRIGGYDYASHPCWYGDKERVEALIARANSRGERTHLVETPDETPVAAEDWAPSDQDWADGVTDDQGETPHMGSEANYSPSYADCFPDPWAEDYAAIVKGEI
jgi:hypothetical protein